MTLLDKIWFFEIYETKYVFLIWILISVVAAKTYSKLRKDIPDVL